MKRDFYQEVTNKLIAMMEKGKNPIRSRWQASGEMALPLNMSTGNHYKGLNILLLWLAQEQASFGTSSWMTYKQALEQGGQVHKGEKGTTILFYKTLEHDTGEVDIKGDPVIGRFPMLRTFTVFNSDQIDGVQAPVMKGNGGEFEPDQRAEGVLASSGVTMREGGTRAFYRPSTDQVHMPDRYRFSHPEDYYAVALHELTHATKAKHRCDRPCYESDIPKAGYAFEELVAEIGAAFLMANLSLPGIYQDHADYLSSWLQVLRDDKRAIFKAAAQAQKAHDWIMTAYQTSLQRAC